MRCLLVLALIARGLSAQPGAAAPHAGELPAWWQDARVGLHWNFGLSALAGGGVAALPPDEPDALAARFRARAFDASEWARISKHAGAAFVVFPARGADGFCLFASSTTDFDVRETPHERDMLRAMGQACRQEGLALGVAFALADRHHARSGDGRSEDLERARTQLGEIERSVAPDLILLLAGAAPVVHAGELRALADQVRTWPRRVVLAGDPAAAARLPDAFDVVFAADEPANARTPVWRELALAALATGVAPEPADALAAAVARAACAGRGVVIRVAPDADGTLPAASLGPLAGFGAWIGSHAAAVLGTEPAALGPWPFGGATAPRGGTQGPVHVLVFAPPRDGRLVLRGLAGRVDSVGLLGAAAPEWAARGDDLELQLPPGCGPVPVLALHGKHLRR